MKEIIRKIKGHVVVYWLVYTVLIAFCYAIIQQPTEIIRTKIEIQHDTVVVNKIVYDTIYLTKDSLKNSPYFNAVLALKSLNKPLYSSIYDTYEYNKFPYKCGEGIVNIKKFARMHKSKLGHISLSSINIIDTLPIKHYNTRDSSMIFKDGIYSEIRKDTLRCTIIKNGWITNVWDVSRNGKITNLGVNNCINIVFDKKTANGRYYYVDENRKRIYFDELYRNLNNYNPYQCYCTI